MAVSLVLRVTGLVMIVTMDMTIRMALCLTLPMRVAKNNLHFFEVFLQKFLKSHQMVR